MTRKECIDYIKSNGYSAEATELARDYTQNNHANYTNLPTEELANFVNSKKNTKKPVQIECRAELNSCTDKNARKAIMAIAELIGYKNIKKYFD